MFTVYEDEQALIPELMNKVNSRDDHIHELNTNLDKMNFVKQLHEEDNLRLRALITDMQYSFESVIGQKNIEISRLTGRVRFLEEELYHLNRLPQNKYGIADKNEFDPSKIKELERLIKLKDTEMADITQQLAQIKQQISTQVQEAAGQERKKVQNEEQFKNLPFLVENDNLKKENSDLKRQLIMTEAEAEVARQARKLREYAIVDKMREEGNEEFKKNQQPVFVKVSEDKNLLDGFLSLVHYVRESVNDLIFEIFMRSANQAYSRKQSSCILFTINVKELKERNVRGLIIVLYLYKKMRQFVKVYFPYYGKLILHDHLARLALGEDENHLTKKRDNVNMWLEQGLGQVNIKRKKQKGQDEEYNNLFRLLSLKYRIKYPIHGLDQMKIDLDLRIRLENKICTSLLRLFIDD
ncbi:hypothetical protein pb186bvf_012152 [Paramecium bursaria]